MHVVEWKNRLFEQIWSYYGKKKHHYIWCPKKLEALKEAIKRLNEHNIKFGCNFNWKYISEYCKCMLLSGGIDCFNKCGVIMGKEAPLYAVPSKIRCLK